MAALTAKRRNRLPGGVFALPGRRYPLDTANRARNALVRVAQHGSPEEKTQVRRKVAARYPGIEVSGLKKASSRRHGQKKVIARKG